MIKISLYNNTGKKEKEMELDPAIFGVEPKGAVVHQVYVAQMANARQVLAHTKHRGDVAGGGRKPWAQKGTGRARQGSIRAPQWRGGGIVFGPTKDRNFSHKINKKMKQVATKMCLSDKVHDERFLVVEALDALEPKTKHFAVLLNALPSKGKTALFLMADGQHNVVRSMRNIPKLDVERAQDVSVVDLVNHQFVVTTPDGVKLLADRFNK
ncbi:MAG TPA: 50S ribosomal protein L4 [Candidatus Magasanikbacteria bacterium]|nr:50S ribosomal protein L4 [Candidatus Magasanikbacteria bacterium]